MQYSNVYDDINSILNKKEASVELKETVNKVLKEILNSQYPEFDRFKLLHRVDGNYGEFTPGYYLDKDVNISSDNNSVEIHYVGKTHQYLKMINGSIHTSGCIAGTLYDPMKLKISPNGYTISDDENGLYIDMNVQKTNDNKKDRLFDIRFVYGENIITVTKRNPGEDKIAVEIEIKIYHRPGGYENKLDELNPDYVFYGFKEDSPDGRYYMHSDADDYLNIVKNFNANFETLADIRRTAISCCDFYYENYVDAFKPKK